MSRIKEMQMEILNLIMKLQNTLPYTQLQYILIGLVMFLISPGLDDQKVN